MCIWSYSWDPCAAQRAKGPYFGGGWLFQHPLACGGEDLFVGDSPQAGFIPVASPRVLSVPE